jgi:hypothetical protein
VRDGNRDVHGEGPVRIELVRTGDQCSQVDEDPLEIGSREDNAVLAGSQSRPSAIV